MNGQVRKESSAINRTCNPGSTLRNWFHYSIISEKLSRLSKNLAQSELGVCS